MPINPRWSKLAVGSSGGRVELLEKKLKKLGYLSGPADTKFDQRTAKAVLAYKGDNGWESPRPVAAGRLAESLGLLEQKTQPPKTQPPKTQAKPSKNDEAKPTTLRGGTYNCRIGRNPAVVKKVVSGFVHRRKLDFIQLQEISGYHKQLNGIHGYKLITFPGSKDHGETGVLVRKGLDVKNAKSIEAATGWTNVHHRPAQPRAATSVRVAGWLQVGSVHAPPGINWHGGHAVGGDARVRSYASLTSRLAAAANNLHERNPDVGILYGGDWNEGAVTGGPGSPSSLAARTGMKKYADGRIDWEMALGAKVSKMNVGPSKGSDHRLVTFTVTQPRKNQR